MKSSTSLQNLANLSTATYATPAVPTVRLLGHRGARGEFIENSEYGFKNLQQFYLNTLSNHCTHLNNKPQRQLVGIEFDVQLTSDGVLVVVHDETLERFYRLQAHINELSYIEIKKLTQPILPIIRLQDLLPLLSKYPRIELEIKTHSRSQPQKIVDALIKTFASIKNNDNDIDLRHLPITLTSFDENLHVCLQRHTALASFARGLLIEKFDNPEKINLAKRLGCGHLGLYYAAITPKIIASCKKAHMTTSAWTVNEAQHIDYLASIGVDFIITDYPCLYSKYNKLPIHKNES
ncbi:glycerophosphodiester phosphodiesterase [Psychrobacter sp. I-STPA10]|uniref:glycerophosphodiester phosphodiesterase n=1 Tax=Psychrobacter sp. I-STPA10 TaxID=2585769 RepID=UPI001E38B194|nr:glycerophosphodiester phosphodiesterase [Psychrobacter sp. I-STPA10]